MMSPRVLVIDDLFGRLLPERSYLCRAYGLHDVSPDAPSESVKGRGDHGEVLADVMFCSSQRDNGGELVNDVSLAMEAVESGWPAPDRQRWALVLLDLRFVSGRTRDGEPDGRPGDDDFGLLILEAIRRRWPDLPVVILSSRERSEIIERCRRLGAVDFIQRHGGDGSVNPREVLALKLHEYGLLEDRNGVIVGRSLELLKTLAAARRAATGSGNILILGETGVGKELLARYIHEHSPKAKGPYVVFHAFGTTETLQADELFGHIKGAFTDAKSDKKGVFEQADGGTLFLDEIADIPETLQNQLLRPVESRRVTRQGEAGDRPVDIQLVLATNKSLDDYAATGQFKFDLLNRIRAYPVVLPPLRERTEDIPLLAETMLERICRDQGARWPREVHADVHKLLTRHDWREGNVRELRNVLERVVKDNKDSELVLPGDLRLEAPLADPQDVGSEPSQQARGQSQSVPVQWAKKSDLPMDYAGLHGAWPPLQRDVALTMAELLARALAATKKHRAGEPSSGEVNLAGAVGCLFAHQISTVQAADFVKRVMQFDPALETELITRFPDLGEALQAALRYRPRGAKSGSVKRKEAQ
ncbi:MAG TPA: sigma-54-dependent Fis family transcriptional regulator [Gammaproteobacteria bacterium]|nr:sigma-54-dependent Fis family transcriptional regulator [Gammaproteobacteria bacterium]